MSDHLQYTPASLVYDANNGPWSLQQGLFTGNHKSQRPIGDPNPLPVMTVNVATQDALRPDVLARVLSNPLELAFTSGRSPSWQGKKFTIRFDFQGRQPNRWHAKQINEFASGDQGSEAIIIARRELPSGGGGHLEFSVPLMRATVVERVARELYNFIEELRTTGMPLKFNGREVHYDHLLIVNVFRPTPASMQPTLEILPAYRHLYIPHTP